MQIADRIIIYIQKYTHQGCNLETQYSTFSPLHRYSSLMVYKLPVEDVRPLSEAFFKLERRKCMFRNNTPQTIKI